MVWGLGRRGPLTEVGFLLPLCGFWSSVLPTGIPLSTEPSLHPSRDFKYSIIIANIPSLIFHHECSTYGHVGCVSCSAVVINVVLSMGMQICCRPWFNFLWN